MILVAYYFGLIVYWQEWPILAGPYEEWAACASVREYLDRRNYLTDSCALLPYPQESQAIQVGGLPREMGTTQVMPLIPMGQYLYNSQTGETSLVVPQGNNLYQLIPMTPPTLPGYNYEETQESLRYFGTPRAGGEYSPEDTQSAHDAAQRPWSVPWHLQKE